MVPWHVICLEGRQFWNGPMTTNRWNRMMQCWIAFNGEENEGESECG